MSYKRQVDESREAYILRLCDQKELQEWSWDTLCMIANEELSESHSESYYRKMYKGYVQLRDAMEVEGKDSSYIDEIEQKKFELRKEAQKLYDQRREYNKLAIQEGRAENLEARLIEIAESLKYDKPLEFIKQGGIYNCDAVLFFADWHYGQTSDNIFNTYNIEICKQRVSDVVSKALKKFEIHGCNTLHVLLMGDLSKLS